MIAIKIILITLLLSVFVIYLVHFRNRIMDRLIFFFLFVIGVVFIVFPESANWVAQSVGIGRGADLLLYLSIISFMWVAMLLYNKIKNMEALLTSLVRKDALNEYERTGGKQE